MKRLWKLFLAYMRWSDSAVCEISVDGKDFHDYVDDKDGGAPMCWHLYTCSRCGKKFTI